LSQTAQHKLKLTVCTEDASFIAEEQASFNVDALVNETEPEHEPTRSVPSTPMSGHFFVQPRRATPTIPPGFSAPAIPRAVIEESKSRPGSRPMSRTASSTITPAVPVIPVTPIRADTSSKAKKVKQSIDLTPGATISVKPPPVTPTKATSRAIATKTPTTSGATRKSKEDASVQKKQPQKEDEKKSAPEIVVKDMPKTKSNKKTQTVTETTPQKKATKESKAEPKEVIPGPVVTPGPSAKRQPPGKLDITAATQTPMAEHSPANSSQKADAQTRNTRAMSTTATPSVPASPAAAATGSPIKRSVAPRTLRVIPTPKTEVPPPLSAGSAPPLPQISTVDKLRSRQASIASVNFPGTPMSEMISDTASVTSASVSRASSPPPVGGKVGTAPVRQKTKSQAKKDRQERKRQIEEELVVEENKSDVEIIQAPIVGRKKKAKKPATTINKPVVAAPKIRPASPKPVTVEDDHSDVPVTVSKPVPSAKSSTTATPDPEFVPEPKERREHNAQSIIADLQKTGELLASTLEFFKPLSSSLTHASRTTPATNTSGPPDLKIHFSEADLETLAKKKPVRLNGHDDKPDSRTLITPNGKFFWGLSEELEEKALELERQIEELRGHARFHPRKQTSHSHSHNTAAQSHSNDVLPAIATALKEAGKKLGGNNIQQMPKLDTQSVLNETTGDLPLPPAHSQETQQPPPPPQPQTPADAGAYLNQFVLPKTDNPPPNQPRPEMAAVGGAPGAGTANISVNVGKFAKAAKAVVEGGAVGSTEIDGMGMMAADLLGGVFVQGLEALVGAGLGFESSQEFGLDANGNITLGRGGGGLDVQGLMNAIESTNGFGGNGGSRYGRGSVMSMEEAERAMHAARKEHEVLEKKLASIMKKNKKLFGGTGKV
jgi:CCR4-NOT transcription complex subunit 4